MESIMAVCNVYKLFKNGSSYVKDGMKAQRTNIVLKRDYAEQKNAKWSKNGLWHEIDEEATKDFVELREQKRLERKESKKAESKLNELLTDVIKKGSSSETEDEGDVKKELKAQYKELYGKSAFHGWDIGKLKEKINEKTK